MNNDYKYLLTEAVEKIISRAKETQGVDDYNKGRRMAYFEMLQTIQDTAEDIGADLSGTGLSDFYAGELVGLKKAA
jgi:hypothetical protein